MTANENCGVLYYDMNVGVKNTFLSQNWEGDNNQKSCAPKSGLSERTG